MNENSVTVWDSQLKEIKKSFGKGLNDAQFTNFMQIGKALGLNPFMKEIFAVNYNGDVSVFVARDGYRRNAVANPEYDGHIVDSIYEGDTFRVAGGVPEHVYSTEPRKKLLGAYAICYKKSTKIPFFVKVNFSEYFRDTHIWKTKAETMIKKVAESQCLKGSFPEIFRGTYDASEQWENNVKNEIVIEPKPEPEPEPEPKPKPQPDNKKYNIESEPIDLSDAVVYDPTEQDPEFDNLYQKIVKGWNMLQYHDVHRVNSLKKYFKGATCLNQIKMKEDLELYLEVLRSEYKEKLGA